MAEKEEKKTVKGNEAGSGPDGNGRPVDISAGPKSLLDQIKEDRERKAKRLKEITGK